MQQYVILSLILTKAPVKHVCMKDVNFINSLYGSFEKYFSVLLQEPLFQHVRLAVFQSNVWLLSKTPLIDMPSPMQYGWNKEVTGWKPHWTDNPVVDKACRELLKGGCKALPECSHKCKCHETNLCCTSLCAYEGGFDFNAD